VDGVEGVLVGGEGLDQGEDVRDVYITMSWRSAASATSAGWDDTVKLVYFGREEPEGSEARQEGVANGPSRVAWRIRGFGGGEAEAEAEADGIVLQW
jgi:hypothetical protein